MAISERTSQNVELAFVISLVYRNTAKVDLQYLGVGLWYLMPLLTIFQLYRGGQFYWWRKPEYPEKTTDFVASH
jgi:hypothetical protein